MQKSINILFLPSKRAVAANSTPYSRERPGRTLFRNLKAVTFLPLGTTVAVDVLSTADGSFFIGVFFPAQKMPAAQPVYLEVHGL